VLSIRNLHSSRQAAAYFARDDYYYRSQQHQPATWWGRGAERLGLSGAVDRTSFEAALEGQLHDGTSLVGRAGKERRPGFDLTFSAPKSVSLVALVHRSEDVVRAHEAAVSEALGFLEQKAALTRTTEAGVTRDEETNNLVVARFAHDTSRDLDPQLHTHCVVINATRREDGAWRSISNERFYALKMVGGAIYRAHLAAELRRLGYEIDRTHADGRFEIRGFTDHQLAQFSQRRAAIEGALVEHGLEGAVGAKQAALMTRHPKREVDRDTLLDQWRSRATEMALSLPVPEPRNVERLTSKAVAEQAVDRAIDHLSERRVVFDERRLLARALGEGVGRVQLRDVDDAIRRRVREGELVHARPSSRSSLGAFATSKGLQLERSIVATMQLEQGRREPIFPLAQTREWLEGQQLTEGQASAVELIISTRDGIVGVQGYAGTGKTTALNAVRDLAERGGFVTRGFAPSAAAAAVIEKEAGIPSQTVASYLIEEARGEREIGQPELWIVDEASMLGNRDARALMAAARNADARLVFIGDWDQLPSVDAGAAFRLLAGQGMAMATMDEILRQRDPILQCAVQATIERTGEELRLLAPSVEEVRDRASRLDAIAKDYLERDDYLRSRTLVLTASNDDRRELNERIRAGLVAEGKVADSGRSSRVLVSKDLTEADTRQVASYRVGDVVRFEREYRRIDVERGSYWTVTSIDRESGTIDLDGHGRSVAWQPHRAPRVEAYEQESRSLAIGERIRWTRNDRSGHRRNGDVGRVVSVNGDRVVAMMEGNKHEFDASSWRHWEHAYASTVHAAQGQTADAVLIHVDSERSQLVGHESWYVSISRARDGVRIFTDDKERLPKVIQKSLAQEIGLEAIALPNTEPPRERSLSRGYGRSR
jgi:conjugative relaxase-like TrwC/TraI family protein